MITMKRDEDDEAASSLGTPRDEADNSQPKINQIDPKW